MSEVKPCGRSVVMLTTDRQIDRRILLGADALEASGWHVTIIALAQDASYEDDHRVIRTESQPAELVREKSVLAIYRWMRARLPMNGPVMRFFKQLAWRYLVDQETFYSRLFLDTATRFSPAVFVAHDLPMLPLAAKMAALRNAKLVYDSHELYAEQEFSAWEKKRWSSIEAKYVHACDAIITVNDSIARELEHRYGIDEVNVILNAERPMGLPADPGLFHGIFNLSQEKQVLLYQGGLSAGRNLETLVRAMSHVQTSSVVLVIMGDGMVLDRLRSLSHQGGCTNRVYFHPAVSQQELLRYTSAADVGIIPYQAICLNNYYCTPNKMFEFIAAGIPILGSDLPEIRKLVEGQQIGLVGDMQTPESIASLIDRVFRNGNLISNFKAKLLDVRQRVCWETEEKKLVEIFEALE